MPLILLTILREKCESRNRERLPERSSPYGHPGRAGDSPFADRTPPAFQQSGPSPLDQYVHKCYHPIMSTSALIKDPDFELITEFAQPDAKKRLSLGEALAGATAYNIYRNPLGQLILDPVKAVPASEMWLYENAQALASVKQGLRESAEGKTISRGSFARHARK